MIVQLEGAAHLTGEQKQQIYILRSQGVNFANISAKLGVPRNTVKTFCWRNGLSDAEMKRPQLSPGYRKFCKQCGATLEQKSGSRPKKFCGDKCRSTWWKTHSHQLNRRKLMTVQCPVCNIEFGCYPSQLKRFCSHPCYIAHRYNSGEITG
jgi:IS30 family transposase